MLFDCLLSDPIDFVGVFWGFGSCHVGVFPDQAKAMCSWKGFCCLVSFLTCGVVDGAHFVQFCVCLNARDRMHVFVRVVIYVVI